MPRLKTGEIVKIRRWWHARIDYYIYDEATGTQRRRYITRKADANTKFAARKKLEELSGEFGDNPQALDSAKMTFADLAKFYEETYLTAPQYVDGRKVTGLRSHYDFKLRLKALKEFFKTKRLREITYSDLEKYRIARLKTPIIVGRNTRGTGSKGNPTSRPRSIATVNRELSLLRRVLNVAKRNKWITENPFELGDSLIRPGDEKARERILTRDEEERLLAACTDWRAHLRPVIICALDTGMRRGEMFKLKWADVDLAGRIITIHALNTKTERQRQVAITARLAEELKKMYEQSSKSPESLVFGITTSVKTAFNKVKRIAGLSDLRFHDLRHTHATRLVALSVHLSEVGRQLGHTQERTTYRYVNANIETARRVAAVLDGFNTVQTQAKETIH